MSEPWEDFQNDSAVAVADEPGPWQDFATNESQAQASEDVPWAEQSTLDTPSLAPVIPFPGEEQPAAPRPGPQNALELARFNITKEREMQFEQARERERGMFTPEQIRRLDEGSISENLMAPVPGMEASMVTGEEVLKKFPTMTEGNASILAGALRSAANVWNFAASPFGVATTPVAALAGAPGLIGLAGKTVLGTFAAEAAIAMPEAANQVNSALDSGDPGKITEAVLNFGINMGVMFGAGKGTVDAIKASPKVEMAAAIERGKATGMEQSARAVELIARDSPQGLGPIDTPQNSSAKVVEQIAKEKLTPVVETATVKAEVAVDKAAQVIVPPATPEKAALRFGEPYSEPIVERVGRLGGTVSKVVAQESLQIVDSAKRIMGELSTAVLDDAKRAAGSTTGSTSWMNDVAKITPRAAVGRFHEALETRVRTGNFEHIPEPIRPLAEKLWNANLAIGKLAERGSPNFKASGEAQRMLTGYGMDVVRRGGGKAWNAWAEGLSKANDMPIAEAKGFLRRWKAEMDQPGWDSAHLDRIAQDFKRKFPNVVTHVKPLKGWHEVVHSQPFRYLDQAAQRTAHSVAFREVYPLIQDAETGKWHGSGKLESTRRAVMKELETDAHGAEFDNLMRALQGHPIDTYSRSWNAPDTLVGATVRALNDAAQPIFSAMLSATSFRNIGETMSGGAQIFMGYRRTFEAVLSERKMYSEMERTGTVNLAILDFSFEPTAPGRSIARQSSNLIRRAFAEQISNEFQEYAGAAAARVIANEIRENRLPPGDRERVVSTMRAMGIAYKDAIDGAAGRNEAAVRQFETKAAEFLYGGNRAIAESSPLGANRAFTALFKWHSYPMTKLRQTRSIANNILESAQKKDAAQVYDNAKLFGKHVGGTMLGGALTTGVMALIYEGMYGAGIKQREAQADFPGFIKDSYLMAMGGPVQIAAKMLDEGGDVNSMVGQLVSASAPVGVANDLSRAVLGMGSYEGQDAFGRIGQFVESKTPFSRAIKRGMAVAGLSHENTDLDTSIRAFKRWRKDKYGFNKFESHLVDDYDNAKFRGHMKNAVTALQRGRIEDYEAEIEKALDMEQSTVKKVKQSLRGRKILSGLNGQKLSDEDWEEAQKIVGEKGMEMLQDFDSMLNTL